MFLWSPQLKIIFCLHKGVNNTPSNLKYLSEKIELLKANPKLNQTLHLFDKTTTLPLLNHLSNAQQSIVGFGG